MAIQSKGKRRSRIAACAVENPANLWKALAARRSKRRANLYGGRLSRRGAGRRRGVREKACSVENFFDFGYKAGRDSVFFGRSLI